MKCVVLAAGYATRLYPITENFPKPLLKVGKKTIIDWLVDDIQTIGKIDEYIVISNHKFIDHFNEWAKTKPFKVTVIDDGTISNETRLGAVKDIQFAIDKLNISDDMLVIAGDNLLDFSFSTFIDYALEKNASCVMRYFEKDVSKLQKAGVMKVDDEGLILDMVEKPFKPQSNWCCPPFYYYCREDVKKVRQGILDGCGTDAPGSFIAWLCKQSKVYAMEMKGDRYDIGDLESYTEVQSLYKGIIK